MQKESAARWGNKYTFGAVAPCNGVLASPAKAEACCLSGTTSFSPSLSVQDRASKQKSRENFSGHSPDLAVWAVGSGGPFVSLGEDDPLASAACVGHHKSRDSVPGARSAQRRSCMMHLHSLLLLLCHQHRSTGTQGQQTCQSQQLQDSNSWAMPALRPSHPLRTSSPVQRLTSCQRRYPTPLRRYRAPQEQARPHHNPPPALAKQYQHAHIAI